MSGDLATVPAEEFNLATYFLNNDGGDYVTTVEESPENWWPGHDIKLGAAVSPRERESSGLWKRTFTEGVAYTLEPGATSDQTVKSAPGSTWLTIEGREVTEVTLAPGTGAVLRYAAREHEHHRHHGECADGTREGRHGRSDRREGRHGRSDRREGRHGRSDRREGRHGRSDRRDHAHAAERSRRGR